MEAEKSAIDETKKYTGGEGNEPKILHYGNYGSQFNYTISGKSINKFMSQEACRKSKNQGVQIAVLNDLDEIIGSSIELEEHPDYLKGEDVIRKAEDENNPDCLIHRFEEPIDIGGKVYRVKITIREPKSQNRNNREYTYEVTNVEVPNEESSSTSNGVDKSTSQKEVLSYPLAKLLKGVRKSYEENKNIFMAFI